MEIVVLETVRMNSMSKDPTVDNCVRLCSIPDELHGFYIVYTGFKNGESGRWKRFAPASDLKMAMVNYETAVRMVLFPFL